MLRQRSLCRAGMGCRRRGQSTDDQSDIGKQHAAKPCAPGQRQHTGLGAQVTCNHSLDLGRTLRQIDRRLDRQLQSQLEHCARDVVEQFLVLAGGVQHEFPCLGKSQYRHPDRSQHHQGGRDDPRKSRHATRRGRAIQALQEPCDSPRQPARAQESDADEQQAGQQVAPHDQQQGAGDQQVAGHHHIARCGRLPFRQPVGSTEHSAGTGRRFAR